MILNTLIPTVAANLVPGRSTNTTTMVVPLGDINSWSVQASFSGSNVVGVFSVQYSVDGITYPSFSTPKTVSVTGSAPAILSDSPAPYAFIEVIWVYTSGTGNITVTFCGKQLRLETN